MPYAPTSPPPATESSVAIVSGTTAVAAGYSDMPFEKQLTATADAVIELDQRAHEFVEPYSDSWPVQALDLVSKLGDQPQIRTISGALILAGTFAGKDRLVRAGARMMIAHESATLAKTLVKNEIDRTRPRSARSRRESHPRQGRHTSKEKTSFPSGHSAGATAAARAFAREFPEYRAAALGAAGLLGLAQIVRRAHYPTDVAAGVVVGLAAEAVTNAAWSWADMDARSESKA